MNKDEILEAIISVEKEIEDSREEWSTTAAAANEANKARETMQTAYDEVKAQLEKAVQTYREKMKALETLKYKGSELTQRLETLKRELSRLLDTERINAEYEAQLNTSREKTLTAPWRIENREDGQGAKEHQIEGAIHLAVAKQGLLGDKRGLGKTLTALIYCDLVEAKKVICIVPSDTMDQFIGEIKKWTPHRSPIKLGKMDRNWRDVVLPTLKTLPEWFIVTNYEAWRKDPYYIQALVELEADTLVLDEAHRSKTLDTTTCKGVLNLRFGTNTCPNCGFARVKKDDRKGFQYEVMCECGHTAPITEFCSIKHVLPMTGTPILNRPQELFPQLRIIDPKNFQSERLYLADFCWKDRSGHWTWRYGGEKALVKKIGPRYLARDRKSAGVVIPPPTPVVHTISMDYLQENYPNQYRAYEQARQFAQIVLDPDNEIVMSMPIKITVILRLRQVMVWPAGIKLEFKNPESGIVEWSANLDVYESAKLDKAEELIREIVDEGERVVLFSQFKSPLRELQHRLGNWCAVFDGDTPEWERTQIKNDFNPATAPDEPRWKAVLCNYKTGGVGLNLQAASQMILLDEEWNPGGEDQAVGRIDRMGQTRETTIHWIRVEPSIDSWMAALIEEKRNLIGGFETEHDVFMKAWDALRKGEI